MTLLMTQPSETQTAKANFNFVSTVGVKFECTQKIEGLHDIFRDVVEIETFDECIDDGELKVKIGNMG